MKNLPLFKVLMSAAAAVEVEKVLTSGYVAEGERVLEFEHVLARGLEAPGEILAINSCTSALDLALHLAGVGPGDEVITTPQTCTATNTMIVNRRATCIWADIHPLTGNIDPVSVAGLITPKTKAIMAVDWGGLPCDYKLLKAHGIPVIEDAAHAFRARYLGESIAKTGGDYVCWSFQAIKHLTTGDGGAIKVPKDQETRARLLRWYGLDRRGSKQLRCAQDIEEAGYKYHMNDIAAAIGLANYQAAVDGVEAHRARAAFYDATLVDVDDITTPAEQAYSAEHITYAHESSWWLYTLLVEDRRSFIDFMHGEGIETSPVHLRNDRHPAFARASEKRIDLPGVDYFSEREVAIPVGWWLTLEDVQRIADAVKRWSKRQ